MTTPYLTVAQTAEHFGLSTASVYNLVTSGQITYMRLPGGPKKPGAIRIQIEAFEKFTCEANPSSSTSGDEESSTSNTRRQEAAGRRWRVRVSKVVPITRQPGR